MKYKAGDRVKIKSNDFFNKNKGNLSFYVDSMALCFSNEIVTIKSHGRYPNTYRILEDEGDFLWTDEMIEGLVEEENNDCEKCGLIRNSTRCLFMDNCPHNKQKNIIEIPEGYIFKDENGNVINATKIVLEKKEKEYPKTYEECAKIMNCPIAGPSGWLFNFDANIKDPYYRKIDILMGKFTRLLICRDAYWKIAGEEMGLGKPWKPNDSSGYCTYAILRHTGHIRKSRPCADSVLLEFPTEEIRDAFYENFKEEIETVKELL